MLLLATVIFTIMSGKFSVLLINSTTMLPLYLAFVARVRRGSRLSEVGRFPVFFSGSGLWVAGVLGSAGFYSLTS